MLSKLLDLQSMVLCSEKHREHLLAWSTTKQWSPMPYQPNHATCCDIKK